MRASEFYWFIILCIYCTIVISSLSVFAIGLWESNEKELMFVPFGTSKLLLLFSNLFLFVTYIFSLIITYSLKYIEIENKRLYALISL